MSSKTVGREELLVLKNLSVWYTKGRTVLDQLSMELGTNEVVGLIGLNGAGKTTLIKTLSGLIDSFGAEAALWQDEPLFFRNREFKKNRYVVFDEDHSFRFFTFREYLSYVGASYEKTLSDPEIEKLAQGFHFEEYMDVLLNDLSMGNRKKVYLITAFALKPKLLMLDEPVNGLDFKSTEYLYQLIGGYRQFGTVLFSSHILESICLTSDRVLVLEEGQIKQCFAGQEIEADKIREELEKR